MSVAERVERRERVRFERVFSIEFPGYYVLDTDPNKPEADYKSSFYTGNLTEIGPRVATLLMYHMSNRDYPDAVFRGLETTHKEGKRIARLVPLPEFCPEYPFYLTGVIELGDEVYEYHVGSLDIFDRRFLYSVSLEDIKTAWVANNAFRTYPTKDRDGVLKVVIDGRREKVPTFDWKQMRWHGIISLKGDKQGTLIQDAVGWLNRLFEIHPEIPVWKSLTKVLNGAGGGGNQG